MSDATPDPAPADEPQAADATTPVVDDSVGTDAPEPDPSVTPSSPEAPESSSTSPTDTTTDASSGDAVDPTVSTPDSSASPSAADAAASPTPTDGGAVDSTAATPDVTATDAPAGDASDPSVGSSELSNASSDSSPDQPTSSAPTDLPESVTPSPEPVVTAASAAGTVALPDVTGGGVPDPSSTDSSTPSDVGTTSGDQQPSASSTTSSTPIYDELIASSGEGEVLHSEVAPNLSDPTPTNSYANNKHRIFKHGIAWYLGEVGWIGPEATTVLEEDLVPLRDLLNTVILDLGL